MYTLKLTYFDVPGGRGEPARLAMHIGGIEFEDFRFGFDRFKEVIVTTPLLQVPTLCVDGKQITQSNAINRFLGKITGLYPKDNFQALLCDEISDALEDVSSKVIATSGMKGEELRNARETLITKPLIPTLKWLASRLAEQGGEYFADSRLTMADLKAFVWINSLNSGALEHIPTTLVKEFTPTLNQHNQRVAQSPPIVEYYAQDEANMIR